MSVIGRHYKDAELVSINAYFICMWGLGCVLGPVIAGNMMQFIGIEGMPIISAVLCVLYIAYLLYYGLYRIMLNKPYQLQTNES